MHGLVPAVTAAKAIGGEQMVMNMRARFAAAPGWNGGHHYGSAAMSTFMTSVRVETLKRYGIEAQLASQYPDPARREEAIWKVSERWAKQFDPHSMIALSAARAHFDAEKDFAKIRAKVLYVLSRTDKLFPPTLAPAVMEKLKRDGVDADYFEIDSDKGHLASGADWAKWAARLSAFLARLPQG
ncbi:MAG: hypothetical protein ACREQR_03795 [Candidatus Binataceae bacterium]